MLAFERFGKVWVSFENFKLFSGNFRKVILFYKLFTRKLAELS